MKYISLSIFSALFLFLLVNFFLFTNQALADQNTTCDSLGISLIPSKTTYSDIENITVTVTIPQSYYASHNDTLFDVGFYPIDASATYFTNPVFADPALGNYSLTTSRPIPVNEYVLWLRDPRYGQFPFVGDYVCGSSQHIIVKHVDSVTFGELDISVADTFPHAQFTAKVTAGDNTINLDSSSSQYNRNCIINYETAGITTTPCTDPQEYIPLVGNTLTLSNVVVKTSDGTPIPGKLTKLGSFQGAPINNGTGWKWQVQPNYDTGRLRFEWTALSGNQIPEPTIGKFNVDVTNSKDIFATVTVTVKEPYAPSENSGTVTNPSYKITLKHPTSSSLFVDGKEDIYCEDNSGCIPDPNHIGIRSLTTPPQITNSENSSNIDLKLTDLSAGITYTLTVSYEDFGGQPHSVASNFTVNDMSLSDFAVTLNPSGPFTTSGDAMNVTFNSINIDGAPSDIYDVQLCRSGCTPQGNIDCSAGGNCSSGKPITFSNLPSNSTQKVYVVGENHGSVGFSPFSIVKLTGSGIGGACTKTTDPAIKQCSYYSGYSFDHSPTQCKVTTTNDGYQCTTSGDILCKGDSNIFKCATPPISCSKQCPGGVTIVSNDKCSSVSGFDSSNQCCKQVDTGNFAAVDKITVCSTSKPTSCGPGGMGISTALGCIPTDPATLIQSSLRVITFASGGIALLLMAFGAIGMMTSLGNPEKLKNAQGQFTSAVVGLLFVIFAVLLMQIIGVDILNLPGFGR